MSYDEKNNMLMDVAHELQTPIAIIAGNLELLESDGNKEQAAQAMRVVRSTLAGMSRLVNDVLRSAALDGAQKEFGVEIFNVYGLLCSVRDDCAILAMNAGIGLEVQAGEDVEIKADRRKVREVLLNLIGNALRHTGSGGRICLRGCLHGAAAVITIEDTGSGIAPADLPRIFERFYKIDKAGSRHTGIGLHLCRQIVEAHHGVIWAESQLGKGTKFSISLPL